MERELFDRTHLATATAGNTALQREVIALFFAQSDDLLTRLGGAMEHWPMLAHTMKGSARNVGALAVARAAEQVEAALGDPAQALAAIRHLEEALAATRCELDDLLVGAGAGVAPKQPL